MYTEKGIVIELTNSKYLLMDTVLIRGWSGMLKHINDDSLLTLLYMHWGKQKTKCSLHRVYTGIGYINRCIVYKQQ